VHADGGACHGTPIIDGQCPKCGIAPDTQSTELWPALAATADWRPRAGWVERSPGSWFLEAGDYLLQVSIDYDGAPRWTVWLVTSEAWISRRAGNAASVKAAQLAAEDSLRAIAAEILRAVGA